MSYTKPGYYEIPDGKLLVHFASLIVGIGPSWEQELAALIDKFGRGGRRVVSLSVEDVVSLKGEGVFDKAQPTYRAAQHLLLRFLKMLGVIDNYAAVIAYSRSPKLTIDEVLDRMISLFIPQVSITDMGGPTAFNVEALKSVFPTWVREVEAQGNRREELLKRLRSKIGSIGFKIASGQPIDQAERSAFCAYVDTNIQSACTAQEWRSQSQPKIKAAETGDPLVAQTWDMFKQVTEAGPYLRFFKLTSNRSLEQLVMWFGPQVAVLPFAVGYGMTYGPFLELRMKEQLPVAWSREDQMTAARERNFSATLIAAAAAVARTQGVAPGFARAIPVITAVDASLTPEPSWDLPNITMKVDLDSSSAVPYEYSFFSTWRNRVVSSRHFATPQHVLAELALQHEQLGEGLTTGRTIDSWPLLDLKESEPFLGEQRPMNSVNWTEQIYVPSTDPATAGALKQIPVDMRTYYQRMGTMVLPPAFREYVLAPLAWLMVPDPEAEAHIAAYLGLTHEAKLQAERVIRISHNYAKLQRLLPKRDQLPLSPDQLERLLLAVSNATSIIKPSAAAGAVGS